MMLIVSAVVCSTFITFNEQCGVQHGATKQGPSHLSVDLLKNEFEALTNPQLVSSFQND